MVRFNIRKVLWFAYVVTVVCFVGYFAVLLGIFATDAPGTTIFSAYLVGGAVFAVGMTIWVVLPLMLYRYLKKRAERKESEKG